MADLGTVTIQEETSRRNNNSPFEKIVFSWTSENGGGNAGKASKTTTENYTGEIVRLVTVPDSVDAPTDNYDVTITDEDGTDVLMGAGADRDTVTTEQVLPVLLGCVANDKLTLNISNAGNAKKGKVYLYIE